MREKEPAIAPPGRRLGRSVYLVIRNNTPIALCYDCRMPSQLESPPQLPDSPDSESESTTPAPEQLFGKEVLTPDDVRAISKNIHGLLEEDSPESVYQAARQLAHMKRAGFEMKSSKWREYMQEKLMGQLTNENLRDTSPRNHALYLTFLKYIGVQDEPLVEDQHILQGNIEFAEERADKQGVASLLVMQRYLMKDKTVAQKIGEDKVGLVRQGLQEQLAANHFPRAAAQATRMKYLQLPTGLTAADEQKLLLNTNRVADRYAKENKWEKFLPIINLVGYLGGRQSITRAAARGIPRQIKTLANEARGSGGWQAAIATFAAARTYARTMSLGYSQSDIDFGEGSSRQLEDYESEVVSLEGGMPVGNDTDEADWDWLAEDDEVILPEDMSGTDVLDDENVGDRSETVVNASDKTRINKDAGEQVTGIENGLKSDPEWQEMKRRVNKRISLSLTRSAPERGEMAVEIYADELRRYIEGNPKNAELYAQKWDSFARAAGISPDIDAVDWAQLVDDNPESLSMHSYWSIAQAYKNWKSTSKK